MKSTKQKTLRILSAFLAVLTVLPLGSVFSFGDTEKPVTVLREDESKRKESEKHFLLSDGTMLAVLCLLPLCSYADVSLDRVGPEDRDLAQATIHASRLLEIAHWGFMDAMISSSDAQKEDWWPEVIDFSNDEAVAKIFENNFEESDGKKRQTYYLGKDAVPPHCCARTLPTISKLADLQAVYDEYFCEFNVSSTAFSSEARSNRGFRTFTGEDGRFYIDISAGVFRTGEFSFYAYENMIIEKTDKDHAVVQVPHVSIDDDSPDGSKTEIVDYTAFYGMARHDGKWKLEKVRYNEREDFSNDWIYYNAAPQTGEHTVFYALVAVSALSALAALCVKRKKKRIG